MPILKRLIPEPETDDDEDIPVPDAGGDEDTPTPDTGMFTSEGGGVEMANGFLAIFAVIIGIVVMIAIIMRKKAKRE
ncbi:hypothetical protein IKF92_03885 [Candidatus Saccharibacteria bacterium]|nr:hypothetical protein [Candidatus Saccharibacteria bacterium]